MHFINKLIVIRYREPGSMGGFITARQMMQKSDDGDSGEEEEPMDAFERADRGYPAYRDDDNDDDDDDDDRHRDGSYDMRGRGRGKERETRDPRSIKEKIFHTARIMSIARSNDRVSKDSQKSEKSSGKQREGDSEEKGMESVTQSFPPVRSSSSSSFFSPASALLSSSSSKLSASSTTTTSKSSVSSTSKSSTKTSSSSSSSSSISQPKMNRLKDLLAKQQAAKQQARQEKEEEMTLRKQLFHQSLHQSSTSSASSSSTTTATATSTTTSTTSTKSPNSRLSLTSSSRKPERHPINSNGIGNGNSNGKEREKEREKLAEPIQEVRKGKIKTNAVSDAHITQAVVDLTKSSSSSSKPGVIVKSTEGRQTTACTPSTSDKDKLETTSRSTSRKRTLPLSV